MVVMYMRFNQNVRKYIFRPVCPFAQSHQNHDKFWIAKDAKFIHVNNKDLIRQCRCAGRFEFLLGLHVRSFSHCNSFVLATHISDM